MLRQVEGCGITLTFDTATQGESEGLLRGIEVASRRIEEINKAFLGLHEAVEVERIGVLDICA